MKILALESFYTSSHKVWLDGLKAHSSHTIDLLTLKGRHWKWRMHHGAYSLSLMIKETSNPYDVILASDMIDVAVLRGLLSADDKEKWYNKVPIFTYFHENQLTYPWSENDQDVQLKRDTHYAWINIMSAVSSDHIIFNSRYHKNSFIDAIPGYMKRFPDYNTYEFLEHIKNNSSILPIGLSLDPLLRLKNTANDIPIILWNHRWEYDKNPTLFFNTLEKIKAKGMHFKLIIAGENYAKIPEIFLKAENQFKEEIIHFGYAETRSEYLALLAKADIVPVTSNQDFFGISAVEAIAAGCYPLLPNRLAFPEHLSEDQVYYKNDIELEEKLKIVIKDRIDLAPNNFRDEISKYNWSNLITNYDKTLERLVFYSDSKR